LNPHFRGFRQVSWLPFVAHLRAYLLTTIQAFPSYGKHYFASIGNNRQKNVCRRVSPGLACVVIVSSSNLAGFCVRLCRLARGRSSHCLTIETLCLGQVCAKSGQFLKAAPAGLPLALPPVADVPGMLGWGGAARQRRPPRPLFIIEVTAALRLPLPKAESEPQNNSDTSALALSVFRMPVPGYCGGMNDWTENESGERAFMDEKELLTKLPISLRTLGKLEGIWNPPIHQGRQTLPVFLGKCARRTVAPTERGAVRARTLARAGMAGHLQMRTPLIFAPTVPTPLTRGGASKEGGLPDRHSFDGNRIWEKSDFRRKCNSGLTGVSALGLMAAAQKATGAKGLGSAVAARNRTSPPTLAEQGITKKESSLAQFVSRVCASVSLW
jgi:hypothetical protein